MRTIWLLLLISTAFLGGFIVVPYLSLSQLLPLFGLPILVCIFCGLLLIFLTEPNAFVVLRVWKIPVNIHVPPSNWHLLMKPTKFGLLAKITLISAAMPAGAVIRMLFIVYA